MALKKTRLKRVVSFIAKGTKRPLKTNSAPPRRTTKPKKKAWKFVKSHLQECDEAFSLEIRTRDGYCLFPGCGTTNNLTNSHYFGRGNWNTRFDADNCITLCQTHHFWDKMIGWEFQKQRVGVKGCDWDGRYTVFMQNILGETRWQALLDRANEKKSRKEAILETQKKYNIRQPEALLEE